MNEKIVSLLINRLKIEKDKKDRSGIYGFTQRNLAYNSNKIEGSKLTHNQTSSLFDTGTLKSDGTYIRSKDVEEATGHFIMFNKMLSTYKESLSEDLIKQYHLQLKSGVFEDMANGYPAGAYKTRANIVSNIKTTPPSEVEEEIKKLLDDYNNIDMATFEDIVKFHAEYEKIHPFQDGNGRTGRIIMFKECLKNNIMPFIIEDVNKQEYYDCLNIAQTENNYKSLIEFLKYEQKEYYNNIKDLVLENNKLEYDFDDSVDEDIEL